MLVLNIIITCCIVSVGVWFTMTIIHELGHVLALFFTKCILHNDKKLEVKVLVTFRKGFTQSPLYLDLIESKKYWLIKLNAIAGYLLALSAGIIVFINVASIAYDSVSVKHIAPSISLVTILVTLILWFINLCRSIGRSGDLKHFNEPELFEYIEDIAASGICKQFKKPESSEDTESIDSSGICKQFKNSESSEDTESIDSSGICKQFKNSESSEDTESIDSSGICKQFKNSESSENTESINTNKYTLTKDDCQRLLESILFSGGIFFLLTVYVLLNQK